MERRSPEPPSNDCSIAPWELAVRLLDSHYPYNVADERPRLFAGSLPDDPLFDVPIPAGFVLVGGAVSEPSRGRRIVEVVLDTDLPAARVRDTYRDLLSGTEWSEDNRANESAGGGFARGPRGFLMSLGRTLRQSSRGAAVDLPGLSTIFRHARRQSLIVSAEERIGAQTDVRLRLVTGRNPLEGRQRNDPEALFVMPLLTPPPRSRGLDDHERTGVLAPPFDARYSGGNYGGSGWEHNGAYSYAAFETDLDLASLTAPTPRSSKPLDGPVQTKVYRARRRGTPGPSLTTRIARGRRRSRPCTSPRRPDATCSTCSPTARRIFKGQEKRPAVRSYGRPLKAESPR